VFIAMGGLSVGGITGHRPLGPAAYAIAGLLVVAGVVLFTRRAIAYYVALAAALVTATTGALAAFGLPQLALPVPPMLAIGVGLYLVLRVVMARDSLRGGRAREGQ
jgi:hypothetical protein